MTRIAHESKAAGLILHHLRKGPSGSADDFMGAASLRATFRAVRILARMAPDEAEKIGLPPRQAWRYSRIAGSKENYAPPPDLASWYRLESVALGNSDGLYTEGDNVQVTTEWTPPSPFAGVPLNTLREIFDAIRSGPREGEYYSPDRRAKHWAGEVIVQKASKSKDDAARILRVWLENNVLSKDKYESPERREEVGRVTLNEVKVSDILGPLYHPTEPEE